MLNAFNLINFSTFILFIINCFVPSYELKYVISFYLLLIFISNISICWIKDTSSNFQYVKKIKANVFLFLYACLFPCLFSSLVLFWFYFNYTNPSDLLIGYNWLQYSLLGFILFIEFLANHFVLVKVEDFLDQQDEMAI